MSTPSKDQLDPLRTLYNEHVTLVRTFVSAQAAANKHRTKIAKAEQQLQAAEKDEHAAYRKLADRVGEQLASEITGYEPPKQRARRPATIAGQQPTDSAEADNTSGSGAQEQPR